MTAYLWHEDTPGNFDALDGNNLGFTTRRWRAVIPLMGRVHADLFTQPRIMIDGVDVHIKLTCSPAAFCTKRAAYNINEAPPPDYKIKIDSISLYVRKISPSATCHLRIIGAGV